MRRSNKSLAITIAFPVLVIALSSCEKYIPYEGENAPRRLVLNGQIEADSVFELELSHSMGYVDAGHIEGVENGTVNVFLESGEFIGTLDHVGEGRYRGDQVATAGQGYRVEASAGSYASIFAIDKVPAVVEIAGWDTSGVNSDDPFNPSTALTISFQVNDPGGVENYYMIEAFETRDYELQWIGVDPVTEEPIFDTIFYEVPQRYTLGLATTDLVLSSEYDAGIGEAEVYGNNFLFSDELFNGALRQFQFSTDHFSGTSDLELRLTSLSADLFRYYRSYDRYQNSSGDPFSEPVQVFNNIQGGGLGIWGGRSSHAVVIGF